MNNLLVVYGKNPIEIKHIRRTLGISYKSNGSGVYYYENKEWLPTNVILKRILELRSATEIPLDSLAQVNVLLKLGMTEQDVIDFLNTKPLR